MTEVEKSERARRVVARMALRERCEMSRDFLDVNFLS